MRSRLAELQEEKDLALEEAELRCKSLINQQQNVRQAIQVAQHVHPAATEFWKYIVNERIF